MSRDWDLMNMLVVVISQSKAPFIGQDMFYPIVFNFGKVVISSTSYSLLINIMINHSEKDIKDFGFPFCYYYSLKGLMHIFFSVTKYFTFSQKKKRLRIS